MKRLLVVLAVACSGGKAHQPPPAVPDADPELTAQLAALDQALAQQPDNQMLLYMRASFAAKGGRGADALPFVEKLDATGWDIPLSPRDFAVLADDPKFRAVAARIAARAPTVKRSELAFTIADPEMIPEGIAVDISTGTFYVGSIRKRAIVAVDRDGAARTFLAPKTDGISAVLGLKVDASRGLLWVASYADEGMEGFTAADRGRAEVTAFALADGTQRRKVSLPGGAEPHLLNDVAIAPDGTVYVTDSVGGGVWRIPHDRDVLEPLVKAGTFSYPNGIALASPTELYVAHFTGIAVVDPATGGVTRMEAPPRTPLGGIDGLLLDGTTLLAVQHLGQPRLVAIEVDGARATKLTVLENDPSVLELPTTSTLYEDALYTIANAQLDAIGPGGLVKGKQLANPRIVRTPLPP